MDPPIPSLPASDLAAAVVAWHNRQPFARRISADQVTGLGVLALPFSAPDAPPLGQVLLAPAVRRPAQAGETSAAPGTGAAPGRRQGPLQRDAGGLRAAFGDEPIAGLPAAEVARFALRHGGRDRPERASWPQKDLPLADDAPRTVPVVRFVYCAAIDLGGVRRRVLVGIGPQPAVIGRRHRNPARLLFGVAGVAGALAVVGSVGLHLLAPADPDIPVPLLADAGASAAAGPAGPGVAPVDPARPDAVAGPHAVGQPKSAAPPAPAASADVVPAVPVGPDAAVRDDRPPPTLGAAQVPDIRPRLAAMDRAAVRRESQALRTPDGDPAGAPTPSSVPSPSPSPSPMPLPLPTPAATSETPPSPAATVAKAPATTKDVPARTPPLPAAAAASASRTVYAVATSATRSRMGSQLRVMLMNVPTTPVQGQVHAEVMPVAEGWRAVIWPFDSRAEAEETRRLLAARGVRSDIIAF